MKKKYYIMAVDDYYLPKPFTPAQLMHGIELLLSES